LVEAARVRAGESVLIHSATGGVGLSAIEVARWLGAKIIGSAGTEAKRELLRSMGIEGVFDSRKLPFAAIVADLTGGRGVDVIINSLTGAAIAEGLAALAPYGRFLEIGKRDMWDNSPIGMGSLLQNRSVFGVDLATMTSDDRERVGALLRKVMDMVRDGVFAPLPVTVFPASRAAEGFHLMAAAGHIGKVVIETTAMQVPATGADGALRPDGAHLISGGFGALGLIAAEALVAEGARNLVLCGRAAPTPQAMSRIAELRAKGATVLTRVLDIGDADAVRSLLDEITRTLPPLRGVVHSAGVLSDALLSQITAQDAGKVMHGKVGGARLLDQLTAGLDLDYFLLFSSATALLGSAGQGSYAASNAMLDAIARDRAARSLPALSVGWGPWAEIGLAAAQANRGARMAERGLPLLSPAEGRAVIRRLLHSAGPYAAVMRFEPVSWIDASATSAGRLFDDLSRNPRSDVSADATPSRGIGLSADDPISVLKVIESQLAAVLRQPVDATVTDRTFRSLGVDSLMGLELRNRLERSLGLKLSASAVWNFPTPRQLCSHLVSRLAPPAPADVKLADALQAWEPEQMAARALEDELDEAAAALAEL
jgi:phthiocerol/phenolphthiocerol synthesis type-I polyketide synthase C